MKHQQAKNGFTLLEVAISLGLIVMVFGSVTSLAILARGAEQSSKNNLIAAYLAKEGEGLVRHQRDKNYIDRVSPFSSIAVETNETKYSFLIDYTSLILSSATENVTLADSLKVDKGFYNQTTGEDTNFRRLITTTYHEAVDPMPAYIDVKIEVYWKSDSKRSTYTLVSELVDWH